MTYGVLTFGQTEEGWTCAGFEVTAEKGNPHARVVRLPREDGRTGRKSRFRLKTSVIC